MLFGRLWQVLAACFELRDALKYGLGAHQTFVSHLPVHMDGSCNGLQHYAALGRDAEGAKAVNMAPADAPQDVYREVSQKVAAKVKEDAAAGLSEAIRMSVSDC